MMTFMLRRLQLHGPADIAHKEGHRPSDSGELAVVDKHDPARTKQSSQIEQVDEHKVEAMVPVDKGEVEATTLTEEPGQDDLRLVGKVIDQFSHPSLGQHLKAAVPEPNFLVGIDNHVPWVGSTRTQKTLTDVQSRNGIAEPHFNGVNGTVTDHTVPECLSLRLVDSHWEDVVHRPVERRDDCGAGHQSFDDLTQLLDRCLTHGFHCHSGRARRQWIVQPSVEDVKPKPVLGGVVVQPTQGPKPLE